MPRLPFRRGAGPSARPIRPAAVRRGVRTSGSGRRTKPVRRASAGLSPTRAGALLALIASVAALYGLASSDAFTVSGTKVQGATWTPVSLVEEVMAVPAGQNAFTVVTGDLERRIDVIPSITSSHVSVALPGELVVDVEERVPLVVWKVGSRRFLVDREGALFAELGEEAPAGAASLPQIDDGRMTSLPLKVGDTLDAVTLDAALRLGSLTPADVGTAATSLNLRIDDTNGFTMRTRPPGWSAVFGFYTPTLRTTELIPGQVRLLRSLLAGQEETIERVILADDRSGTIIPKPTPEPTKKPAKGGG